MSTSTRLINYEDSLTMPENRFEEIVHGESRIMPPAVKRHVFLIEKLMHLLSSCLDPREYYVTIAGAGLGIERVPLTYRIPDSMVFQTADLRRDRAATDSNDPYIWAIPELVVECLSASNRKGSIQELLADYAHIGVPEVWLLDPKLPEFTSYRYESGALNPSLSAATGLVTPLLLPSATVDLSELWAAFNGTV